ncbi:MAG: nuclear transport factor 2 family protein [bacterium]
MSHTDLAEQLFRAFQSGDDDTARALCSPDLKAIQNHRPAMDLDALLGFNQAVQRTVKDFHYADAVRTATPDGFVEEHSVRGTLPDGSALQIAACVVATVNNGKITELREYLDGSSARGLIKALAASG